MIGGKLQSNFGLAKALPTPFGEQRLVGNFHHRKVFIFERKLSIKIDES